MTRNELNRKVDNINQQLSNNLQPVGNDSVAQGTPGNTVNDMNAQEMDEMLANIFKRGGY